MPATLGAISWVFTFILPPQIRITGSGSTQARPHELCDTALCRTTNEQAAIVGWDPLRLRRLVAEVLRTNELPFKLIESLMARFWCTNMESGLSVPKVKSIQGIHYYSGHITAGSDPVPVFERLVMF